MANTVKLQQEHTISKRLPSLKISVISLQPADGGIDT